MASAYDVVSIFSITDEATPALQEILAQVIALKDETLSAIGTLQELADIRFTGLNQSLSAVVRNMQTLEETALGLGGGISAGVNSMASEFGAASSAVVGLAAQVAAVKMEMASGIAPMGGGSNVPALIPGETYYSGDTYTGPTIRPMTGAAPNWTYGNERDVWGHGSIGVPALIPGGTYSSDANYGPSFARVPGEEPSAGSEYTPNFSMGGTPEDAPFNEPHRGPIPLYPMAAGGFLGRLSSYAPKELIEAAGIYEAYKGAFATDLAAREAMIQLQINPTSAQGAQDMGIFEQAALSQSLGTIYSEPRTAQIYAAITGMLGFSGQAGLEKTLAIAPVAARFGEVSQLTNPNWGSTQSALASIAYAHMTGAYTPQALGPEMDFLLNLSEMLHTSPQAETSILKYGVTPARALGIDPDVAASYIGFFQRQGLGGTTAGTTFGQILTGLLRSGGPLGAHLTSARNELEHALNLSPQLHHLFGSSAHFQALRDLGLMRDGHITAVDSHGNIDIHKVFQDILTYDQTHPKVDVGRTLYNAFGMRGDRGAEILADPNSEALLSIFLNTLQSRTRNEGVVTQQNQLQSAPEQQFEQAISLTETLISQLAQTTLPLVNPALHVLNETLKGVVTDAQAFNTALTSIETMFSSPNWGNLEKVLSKIGHLLDDLFIFHLPQMPSSLHDDRGRAPSHSFIHNLLGGNSSSALYSAPVGAPTNSSSWWHPQAYHPGAVTVHIHGLTLYGDGDGEAFGNKLGEHIAKSLQGSQITNLGTGMGSGASQYNSGGFI